MSNQVTVYECGLYLEGKYSQFFQSKNESEVDNYIEIMKGTCERGDIRKFKKIYECTSTTPISVKG